MKKMPFFACFGLVLILAGIAGVEADPYAQVVSSSASDASAVSVGNSHSFAPVISANGRWIAFTSTASDLVTNDVNGATPDVFVWDMANKNVRLVSVSSDGIGSGAGRSFCRAISPDGQRIAFESLAPNLVADDTNNARDVFVRDISAGQTLLVSINHSGTTSGNKRSFHPMFAANGRLLVFESLADDLVDNDSNGLPDVFVRDLETGVTKLVSVVPLTGKSGNSSAESPFITPDGRFVAYVSVSNVFAAGGIPSEIHVRDLQSQTTHLASTNAASFFATLPTLRPTCVNPVLSDDGQYVAFKAYKKVSITNQTIVLRHDFQTGITSLIVSNGVTEMPGVQQMADPLISADGRYVAYNKLEHGAIPALGVSESTSVNIWDAQLETNILVTAKLDGSGPAEGWSEMLAFSRDSRFVVFRSDAADLVANAPDAKPQVYVWDMSERSTRLISLNRDNMLNGWGDVDDATITADGRYIAFSSLVSDLVAGDFNNVYDVFICDLEDNTIDLISKRHESMVSRTQLGYSSISANSISADGRYVVFSSNAQNLATNDTNSAQDIFLRDLQTVSCQLVSVNRHGTGSANGWSTAPSISADGRWIAFLSYADDLVEGDTNNMPDIFVRDVLTGTNYLVSENFSKTGSANDASVNPVISPDGALVAFQSMATNLVDFDNNNMNDVFVRDLISHSNSVASVLMSGNSVGAGASENPIISPDSRWVAFLSKADRLTTNSINKSYYQLYLRDMAKSQTLLASVNTNGSGFSANAAEPRFSANSQSIVFTVSRTNIYQYDIANRTNRLIISGGWSPSLSNDGQSLVFIGIASYWLTNTVNSNPNVFVKDIRTGTVDLVSANMDGSGAGNGRASLPVITADGRYVVFGSRASVLASNDTNDLTDLFVRDIAAATTILISANMTGDATANSQSGKPVLSGDGRVVFFESYASNLVHGDYNNAKDIFVLRLAGNDSDQDGMPDDWEMTYFNDLSRDGAGDFDGDGASDAAEHKAGTDPTNTNSIFKALTITSLLTGKTTIIWSAVSGKTYRVQYKDNVVSPTWTNLKGDVTSEGATASKTDETSAGQPQRFYRIILP